MALQALHDRAVHLAHTALGKIQRRADLLHRKLFVVVEDDDRPLVAIEPLGDQPHQIVLLNPLGRVLALLVFEDVISGRPYSCRSRTIFCSD